MAVDQASTLLVAALDGKVLTDAERSFFENESPAGVTLFKRNISPSFAQVKSLCSEIQSLSAGKYPSLICIDQEGGRVSRISAPFPNAGPAMNLEEGSMSEEALTSIRNYGYIVGASLRSMGINTNFAPVLDILTNETNHAIGDRCFGCDAERVELRARAFLAGMQESGVMGCLKHFPGQGDAAEDTHTSGTHISVSSQILEKRELVPFSRMIGECDLVMISHAVYSAYDSVPASLSSKVMVDLLRDALGFSGVVVSDDMNMKAMPQDEASWKSALVTAVANGADLLLVCQGLDRCKLALEALREEAKRSPAFNVRLDEAARRVLSTRAKL